MPNPHAGEVEVVVDGVPRLAKLTLGALAELEAAYCADDLGALVERFGKGRLSALDLIRILGAGLRGAGNALSDEDVRAMRHVGGAAGFAAVVAELLAVTFRAVGAAQAPQRP